jgi:hypothetical protein
MAFSTGMIPSTGNLGLAVNHSSASGAEFSARRTTSHIGLNNPFKVIRVGISNSVARVA